MFTSWSDVSTPAELSMKSVLMRPPVSAYSTRPRCVKPRLPPSPTTRARTCSPFTRTRIVRPVADLGVAFACGFHVGADPTVPQKIDRRLQRPVDHLGRRHLLRGFVVDAERRSRLGRERDALRGTVEHVAALRHERAVVIRPRRTRRREQSAALGERRRRVGLGIDEHVTMIEGAEELDLWGVEHAVAEDVARHVTDADHGERLGHHVDTDLAEVTLHRLPRAPSRDAQHLVVVAVRPAARERVTEPEPVLLADRIRGVAEGGRALVSGDDEVGVVAVVDAHTGRVHDRAVDEVVGDIEHAAHERHVLR